MRREYRERFPCHRFHREPLVSDPGMHQGTCVTHVPWCMSGSLTRDDGENVPGILGACTTCDITYLARGRCQGDKDDQGSAWAFVWMYWTVSNCYKTKTCLGRAGQYTTSRSSDQLHPDAERKLFRLMVFFWRDRLQEIPTQPLGKTAALPNMVLGILEALWHSSNSWCFPLR